MRTALIILMLISASVHSAENTVQLTAEEWARPRHGDWVVQIPALREMAQALGDEANGASIVMRYPGGEEGALWAQELHAWLVTLGIASESIVKQPGSSAEDVIDLWIERRPKER